MTVEFLGDEAIAHLDHEHLVRAKHPMIDRTREYFAFQVDEHAAEFDNVQILTAVARKNGDGREKVEAAVDQFPVEKPVQEQFEIRKTNAHEWYYQRDETYRNLVKRVDELDDEKKKRFPDAFRSHKDVRKSIQKERKHLLESDAAYKETLFATYRANREIDEWLLAKHPELDALPSNRKKAVIDQLRKRFADDRELLTLAEKAKQAQEQLEADYPHLFVTDEEITARKKKAYDALRDNAEFQRLTRERAETHYAQQEYLLTTDDELKRLNGLLKE